MPYFDILAALSKETIYDHCLLSPPTYRSPDPTQAKERMMGGSWRKWCILMKRDDRDVLNMGHKRRIREASTHASQAAGLQLHHQNVWPRTYLPILLCTYVIPTCIQHIIYCQFKSLCNYYFTTYLPFWYDAN